MKHTIVGSGLAGLLLMVPLVCTAQTATKADAMVLVEKAAAHMKNVGLDVACKDFANPKGEFIQGELYVFVQDMQAKMICHATNTRLNGKDLSELKDANGKQFSKAMADLAKSKGSGWVDYQWVNPVTKMIEPKTSYIQRVDDTTWLGVGIYRK